MATQRGGVCSLAYTAGKMAPRPEGAVRTLDETSCRRDDLRTSDDGTATGRLIRQQPEGPLASPPLSAMGTHSARVAPVRSIRLAPTQRPQPCVR